MLQLVFHIPAAVKLKIFHRCSFYDQMFERFSHNGPDEENERKVGKYNQIRWKTERKEGKMKENIEKSEKRRTN